MMRSRKTKIILTALLFLLVVLFCIVLFRKWEFGLILVISFFGWFAVAFAVLLAVLWFSKPIIYNIAAMIYILVVGFLCAVVIFDNAVLNSLEKWGSWRAERNLEKEALGIGVFAKGHETRMAEAIVKNDLALVKQLIERGVNMNARSVNGYTFLTFTLSQPARQQGYVVSPALIKTLLDAGVDPNPKTDSYGLENTIEYWRNFNPDNPLVLEALLNGGAEIPDSWFQSSAEDIRLFVRYGADLNQRIAMGYESTDFAPSNESSQRKWENAEWTPIMIATHTGLWDQALTLAELGADVGYVDENGITLEKVIVRQQLVYDDNEQLQAIARKLNLKK